MDVIKGGRRKKLNGGKWERGGSGKEKEGKK